jgi:excisionase family DNA binding protein
VNVEVRIPPAAVEEVARRAAELVLEQLHPGPPASEFVTVEEAAELLRARPQRVYDLLSQGRLTRFKDGSRVLVARAELLAHLAGEAVGPVAHRLPTGARGRVGSGVAR